jgi:hypothetical protein
VSHAVDAFCTNGAIGEIDHNGSCRLDSGDFVCEMDTGTQSPDAVVALPSTTSGDEITCETNGTKITCRIPQRLVEMGNQAVAQSNASDNLDLFPFTCHQVDGIFVCASLFLGPGEMKMDEVQVTTTSPGRFHNFVVTFARRAGGVCKTGIIPSFPCSIDKDCSGSTPECGSGICQGGKSGFGCDADADCTVAGHCSSTFHRCTSGTIGRSCTTDDDCTATGTCTQCEADDGEEILPGLACKTSEVIRGVQAPAMSPWSLAATAIGLAGVAAVLLRRRRRI